MNGTNLSTRWRGGIKVLTGLTFVACMIGGIAAFHIRARAEAPPNAPAPISVATEAIHYIDGYTVTAHFAGRLEPARQTRLAFERAGRVTEVLLEEGDQVNRGAVVARLDTAKLRAERHRLLAQRKELQARQALGKATLRRQHALAAKGWQTAQRHDEARFKLAEISASIERLDAAIASIDVDMEKSILTAPYAGHIAARLIDEGAIVDAGAPILDVLETAARHVRIGVSVEAAQSLENGRFYRLNASGTDFQGRLISKRPDLQTGTRTITVLLEALGAENVPFGEIVELMLDRKITVEGSWLPLSALSEGDKGLWSVLTVENRDGTLAIGREAVEVLHVDAGHAFVRGTIADGAKIVVNGTNRIIPGQNVALMEAE